MTPPPPLACPADDYVTLVATGRDAATFLQGQLTQDVLQLDALVPAALLTPQGRVLATPWVVAGATPDSRRLVLPADLGAAVADHLRHYLLRARLTLALGPASAADLAALAAFVAQRLGAATAGSWPLALVRAGLAQVGAATSGEWIPQMLNLDLVGAISFRKGCYTGQEIVARTQHLGRIKRRMQRYVGAGVPPAPGSALLSGAGKVGEVVLAAADGAAAELLAVVNLEALAATLTLADGRPFVPAPLPYGLG